MPCPCGTARRAFADVAEYPATVHVTSISVDAQLHYHKRLTETYYFLECRAGAQMQLDDDVLPVKPGSFGTSRSDSSTVITGGWV